MPQCEDSEYHSQFEAKRLCQDSGVSNTQVSTFDIDDISQRPPEIERRNVFGIKRLLAALGLSETITSLRREPKKEVCSHSRLAILRGFVRFHLTPILITISLFALYLRQVQWAPSYPTSEQLAALQFGAKAHETFIILSLTEILLYRIRFCLLEGDGIPLGFLTSGFSMVSPIQYLMSWEFWATALTPTLSRRSHILMAGLIGLLSLVGIGAGPFSAITMIPRQGWWEKGNTTSLVEEAVRASYFLSETPYNMSFNPLYHTENLTICHPSFRGLAGECMDLQPILNELETIEVSSHPTPRNLNISWTPGGLIDAFRPITLRLASYHADSYDDLGSQRSLVDASGVVFATVPMTSIAKALREVWPFLASDLVGFVKSRPGSTNGLPMQKWKQPLVAAVCSRTSSPASSDSNPLFGDTWTFDYYEGSFHSNFSIDLSVQEDDLGFINDIRNDSSEFDPVFLDIQDQVPVPISAAMLLVGSEMQGDILYASMDLCLIQARWLDADTWVMTNQPPVTRMELETPLVNGLNYLLETSTPNNIIKMDNAELQDATMAVDEDGARKSNFNTTYGEAWNFCYKQSIYCFPAFVALHLADGLASETPMDFYNPHVPSFTPNYTVIKHTYHQHQYAYSFSNSTTTLILAFVLLILHACIAMLHTLSIALSGRPWYSSGWGSVGQLIALALRSQSAQNLINVGGGVASSQSWKMRVLVKEVDADGHLEMVVRAPDDTDLGRLDDRLYEDYSAYTSIPRLKAGKKYS
ncbi:hypothetical protein EDB81DRAFT_648654 [Dactylonectria macrodidyma]|uniref:Uncharacterized protein n=1 Tax=Dactylonectria macrodidyma TaxID=307937 RepID=A0A9P9J7U0_9HYPO|nr:hypothetical protein EDB81DRAFT_648654 [Dactylonectria macrodidyma]